MVRHKVNSKNFYKFESFTGKRYYCAYYNKKAIKEGTTERGFNNKESFIWIPFWIDNYKRLNSLHNKLQNKIQALNAEMDEVKEPIFSFSRFDYKYALYYKQKVYTINVKLHSKELSFSEDSMNSFCANSSYNSHFKFAPDSKYIQTHTKELNKIFIKWFALFSRRNKYIDYLAKVERAFSIVLQNIIVYENNKTKQIMNEKEYYKTTIINIDGDEIIATVNRSYHSTLDYLTTKFDFSKNIARVSL